MRVLLVEPGVEFSVADVHRGWHRALVDLGVTVASLNLNDRLAFYSQAALKKNGRWRQAFSGDDAVRMASQGVLSAAYKFWPDVVLVTSCFFLPNDTLDLLRARGHKVVLLFTESPYEEDSQLKRAEHADICLINDPTNLDRFHDVCADTYYSPHCYDPAVHYRRPAKPEYLSDVAFVGTAFQSRIDFLEAVDWSGMDVLLGGNWNRLTPGSPLLPFVGHAMDECLDNTDTVDVYCSTKASFNLYRSGAESERAELGDGWACGPREIELAAAGTWFARQSRGESDALFPMLPTFETPADLSDVLRWGVANDKAREKASARAREAIADRTFKNSAARLLQLAAK